MFKMLIVSVAALVLAVGAQLVTSSKASAGSMKNVQISHLEAVANHLYGNFDVSLLNTRKTEFVPAPAGYFFAVASEVYVEVPSRSQEPTFEWQLCTTYFEKHSDEFTVTQVGCTAL